jgi:hypothetical protein
LPNPSANLPIPILKEDGGADAGVIQGTVDASTPTDVIKPAPPAAPSATK